MSNFTQGEVQYLKDNYKKLSYVAIAKHLGRTTQSIYNKAYNIGLKKEGCKRYSKEEIDFLKANYKTMSDIDIAKEIGRSYDSVKAHRKSLGLIKEKHQVQRRGTFKKGNIPHNAHKVGTITKRNDSSGLCYYYIKLPNRKRLVTLHTWLYEQAHGKIPQDYVVRFKDGNTLNCVIENLECVSRAEHLYKNRDNYYQLKEAIDEDEDLKRLYEGIKKLNRFIKHKTDKK